ncbi:peptidoglycan/xylan/chitin deacetylase (PgdA/CDA1 family) [Ruminiclostridium sufflavum DSM 19573]|uniref:endo-1,4-beta-xylanase n=1 Tax=Ruminiclostridium sufflavum DSM 19573 TaxID=1121337 RepID=A0A318XRS8_9FIRM|nr:glycoside hydrolase family 11 protein [Ruminiclostridium sufflavum]PYG90379.1 peptidoglycan/xylan/chitin deacetylase (PgdA/CDA1 family) [Ruminiclostridium sufflavum DSM 19573]
MNKKLMVMFSVLMCFTIILAGIGLDVQAATTLTGNATGKIDGYDYELWKDSGTTSMTLNGGGAFNCSWSNINNALFRTGKKYDETKTWQQLGSIKVNYTCDYQPSGNSYLSVYGWTSSPLVEYYIVDSWGSWRPPGSTSKGTITVDGAVYDLYQTTRVNQPSIKGNTTFEQYWSVRQQKRTSGTITVSDHFKAWEAKGMQMGKMYEVSMVVEGYQSSGQANMTKMTIDVGGSTTPDPDPDPDPVDEKSAFTAIDSSSYNDTNSSTVEKIGTDSGNGVGYIENGNYLAYKNINFGTGAASFKAHVANGNSSSTTIQVRTGSSTGTIIGSLTVPATGGWDTYKDLSTTVSGVSGVKDLYLCFSGPVNIGSFSFSKDGATNPDPGTGETILLGDVDGSGAVDALDYAIYKQYLLGLKDSLPAAGDVDQNGSMDSLDFAKIKQHLLGIIQLGTITVGGGDGGDTPVDPTKKLIALTFDDGPSATLTPLVLDKLDKYGVKATFMMIGQNISSSTAAVIKRVNDGGHEIGNHSWDYSSMNSMSASDIKTKIDNTTAAIKQYSGQTPKFFRAPNLAYSQTMYSAIDLIFVQGVICNDWSGGSATTAQARADCAINGAQDGAIILLHDNQPLPHPTPEALDIIIPTLQNKGYQFVTLSQLFKAKGVDVNTPTDKVYTVVP